MSSLKSSSALSSVPDLVSRKYKAVIFDWDGTLVDSTARIVDSMHRAAVEVGMPKVTDEAVRQIIGLSLSKAIETIWPQIASEQCESMEARYVANFSSVSEVGVSFFDGLGALFKTLKARGYKLAVATGKSRRGLEEMLDGLPLEGHSIRTLFDVTRCADETASKPHPRMLNEILAALELSSEEALMVGDTSFDLDMARAINMDAIAMTYGAHDVDTLQASMPQALCQSLNELQQWIQLNG